MAKNAAGGGAASLLIVLIECEPLPTVDEGQGRSFAPLRINSGKLLF